MNMERIFKFESKQDGLELEGIYMEPENKKKAIIQIVHGMAEHKERYLPFMRYLCNQGYVVVIHDHRGHGQSIKHTDDLGYFYDETGTYIYLDAHDIGMKFKKEYNLPLYLMGHSMGSLVVREVCKYFDKDIDKLIVCGYPSKNDAIESAITLTKFLMKLQGKKHRSSLIQHIAFSSYSKRFNDSLENTWLSENKENVYTYNEDPLCGFTFTLNGFLNLFSLMNDVYNASQWKCDHKELPILFIAGEKDPCIDTKEKWIEAQNFLKQLGYQSIQNHLYENMRHEILNEKEHEIVYKDILDFLESE